MTIDTKKILDAVAAAGAGQVVNVADLRNLVLAIHTAGSANLTVKVAGSIQQEAPDFDAAASPTNAWDYIQIKDLEDASSIDGDVGLALAGTDDQRIFEVNTNHLRWVTVIVTARVAGNVTALLSANNN